MTTTEQAILIMHRNKWTQKQFAKKLGMSLRSLQYRMSGEREWSDDEAEKVSGFR